MTNDEAVKRLSAYIVCLKCEISGKECDDNCRYQYEAGTMGEIVEALETLIRAEPQIIRCKDCKHWIPYDWMFSEVWQSRNINDYPEDEIGCNYCDVAMKANDFCSRAERRTDG